VTGCSGAVVRRKSWCSLLVLFGMGERHRLPRFTAAEIGTGPLHCCRLMLLLELVCGKLTRNRKSKFGLVKYLAVLSFER